LSRLYWHETQSISHHVSSSSSSRRAGNRRASIARITAWQGARVLLYE